MRTVFLILVMALSASCRRDTPAETGSSADRTPNVVTNEALPGAGGPKLAATDQGASDADVKITQAIRKAIVIEPGKDEHSVAARNVTIVTRGGAVTLKGVVRSDEERADVEAKAKGVAGVTAVDNQLVIKAR